MSADWLADALDRLADPAATPGVRLGAVSIARHEAERLGTELERLRAIEQRARETVDVEAVSSPRRDAARYILGEQP